MGSRTERSDSDTDYEIRRNICDEIEQSPENLWVYPKYHLLRAMELDPGEDVLAAVGAELCIRYYLSDNLEYLEDLETRNVLSRTEIDEFRGQRPMIRDICFRQADVSGEEDFWTPGSSLSTKCLTLFRARIKKMMQADGLIPVVGRNGSSGFFLPFQVEKGRPGCYDLDGIKHEEWSKYLSDMGLADCRLELLVHLEVKRELKLAGPSMMLPVLMAWSCKFKTDGVILPKYNPFRLVATGQFENGCLKQVETGGKMKSAGEILFNPTFVYPDDGSSGDTGRMSFLPLPEGISMEDALERIRGYLERELTEFSNDYMGRRYRELWEETRQHIYVDGARSQIEFMDNAVPNDMTQAREYLLRCMLQSQLYYSIGNTARALEKNEEAIDFARKNDFGGEMLRLRIEQIELLVGMERFDQVMQLIYYVEKEIRLDNAILDCARMVADISDGLIGPAVVGMIGGFSKSAEEQGCQLSEERQTEYYQSISRTLYLKLQHTVGIAEACFACAALTADPLSALAESAGITDVYFSRRRAKECFLRALENLKKAMVQPQSPLADLEEFSQAMNDYHWFYALFEPGSEKERERAKMAGNQHRVLKEHKDGLQAFRHYDDDLKLSVFLAWYRCLLRDHAVPLEYEKRRKKGLIRPVFEKRPCEQALLAKYEGALEAAAGRRDKAEELFRKAVEIMPQGNDLKLLSVYAEAFRSLKDPSFLKAARELNKKVFPSTLVWFRPLPFWSEWLDDPSSEFPGLKYWY